MHFFRLNNFYSFNCYFILYVYVFYILIRNYVKLADAIYRQVCFLRLCVSGILDQFYDGYSLTDIKRRIVYLAKAEGPFALLNSIQHEQRNLLHEVIVWKQCNGYLQEFQQTFEDALNDNDTTVVHHPQYLIAFPYIAMVFCRNSSWRSRILEIIGR